MSEADRAKSILPKLNLDIRLAKLARPVQDEEGQKECQEHAPAKELHAESAC